MCSVLVSAAGTRLQVACKHRSARNKSCPAQTSDNVCVLVPVSEAPVSGATGNNEAGKPWLKDGVFCTSAAVHGAGRLSGALTVGLVKLMR